MFPTYEELQNGIRTPALSWDDFQEGDWIGHPSWLYEFYRIGNAHSKDHVRITHEVHKTRGVQECDIVRWVNKKISRFDGRYFIVNKAKDYDPTQQPYEDTDI